jgi:hypothetical protein
MRRYEVYFLQKKVDGVWDTLERSQSVSVLVASMVRAFDAREDAEVRILAGAYDEAAADWEFTQIFFVDRGAVDLELAERGDADDFGPEDGPEDIADDFGPEDGDDDFGPEDGDDQFAADDAPRGVPGGVPGGRAFADAIRRASDDRASDDRAADEQRSFRPPIGGGPALRDLDDDFDDTPVGPPPSFRPRSRRGGRAFFIIGTLLIALVLTGAAVLALMIALDMPQIRPLMSMVREFSEPAMPGQPTAIRPGDPVMPATSGQVVTYRGVTPLLRGRWSPGRCDETYIEFDEDGLVVGTPGRPESLKVPVVETIEDEYTWFVRRSPDLVEHFQRLGPNDIQLIGDTTRSGFSPRTSDILTRCP